MAQRWAWATAESPEALDAACYALRSTRVALPDGNGGFGLVAATVVVENGKIVEICRGCTLFAGPLRDVGDDAILPGLVDAGARFGECEGSAPGSDSDCYEGFERGTRAAAAGGVTCTVDLASRDADEAAANDVPARAALASNKTHVDVALGARLASSPQTRGVLVEAFLTPPAGGAAATPIHTLSAFTEDRGPVFVKCELHATDELEAGSPFRLLSPPERKEARSPLLLLPCCQLDPDSGRDLNSSTTSWASPRESWATGRESGEVWAPGEPFESPRGRR